MTKERQRTPPKETEDEQEIGQEYDGEQNPRTTTTEQEGCPECSGDVVIESDRENLICEDCGLIIDDQSIDHGPDWRSFSEDERQDKSRVGSPITELMHDKGLSTQIGWQNKDAYGRSLSTKKIRKMRRLRTWNQRASTRDSKERNLRQALTEVERMSSALGLPESVREMTGAMYRRCIEDDLLRGRSIEGVSTACLYASARKCNVPRSYEKFGEVSRVDTLEIKRTYRYIMRELGLEIKPSDPKEYLPQFASKLEVPDEVERKAREILDETSTADVRVGKNPVGLAAASLYAASLLCNAGYTQKDVYKVTDISVVTIRNRYQELLEEYGAEFTTAEEAQELYESADGDVDFCNS